MALGGTLICIIVCVTGIVKVLRLEWLSLMLVADILHLVLIR